MRDPLDRYYTPPALAAAAWRELCAAMPLHRVEAVLEPCCGAGAMGRAALEGAVRPQLVVGCDVDPGAAAPFQVDRVPVAEWCPDIGDDGGMRVIFTNPHYGRARDIVAVHRRLQRRTGADVLALLLRASALKQLGDDPPGLVILWRQRPRWGGPGGALHPSSDSVGSCLCVWSRRPGPSRIVWGKAWR